MLEVLAMITVKGNVKNIVILSKFLKHFKIKCI